MSALEDRRQNAREAYYDKMWSSDSQSSSIESAIKTATRVQITPEVILAVGDVHVFGGLGSTAEMLRHVFKAAGFEVIE